MGCNSSRSAGADGVVSTNPSTRTNRTLHQGEHSQRSNDTANAVSPRRSSGDDPLYFSPNRRQFMLEFDDAQRRHAGPFTSDPDRRNTLTILNVPSRTRSRRGAARRDSSDPSDAAVLEQLQIDLVTIERIFQSLLGQPYQGMGMGGGGDIRVVSGDVCPPACQDAIDGLASIRITAEDLEDENNKSCCICFGDHNLDDEVARLPCGHLFHRACVAEWLLKHCTCPFCRWELETDDANFEEGRVERMKSRRIRMKPYELDRMSISELQDLALNASDDGDSASSLEKATRSELINKIKQSKMVDIIAPLDKVQKSIEHDSPKTMYNIDELRSLDIEQLQLILREREIKSNVECTEETDNDDTNEKDRIIQLLVNSENVGKSKNVNPTDIESKIHAVDEEELEEVCVGQAADID